MSKTVREYQRLPGRKRRFFGCNTLWLGKDHLLHIDSNVFAENYKRLYYSDIQAIITRKTDRGRNTNIVLGVFAGLAALAHFGLRDAGAFVGGIIASLLLLGLVINWLRGPTCLCYVHTAVQRQRLPSLSRLRIAERAVNRLTPLVERAQGRLPPVVSREEASNWPQAEEVGSRKSRMGQNSQQPFG